MVILSFDNIVKCYGDTTALRGVSFDVHAGEIFGLLGPNGAGKSTLIRILMDIIRADSGEVRGLRRAAASRPSRSPRIPAGGARPLHEAERSST